ncbi:SURF1 family protein [Anaplasma marginale]|nr:surfeit locus protein 1 [Anaplasma marginale]RCL19821.1 SURF1 family protein [Anaplasma marginale]
MECMMCFKTRSCAGYALLVVCCFAPLALLLSLGTWQLLRLREKLHIIETMRMDPVTLPAGELHAYAYRKVKLQGVFKDEKHIRVFAGKAGYYFLQPFSLVDGRRILVNRGVFTNISTVSDTSDLSVRLVGGVLHCKLRSLSRWVVRNSPEENLWFWFDVKNMSKHIGLPDLEPCILWGDGTTIAGGLQANSALIVRNDHLEYAITWYFLALVWLLGYVYYVRGTRRPT